MDSGWLELTVPGDLDLHLTLSSGQAFRWQQVEQEDVWVGAIQHHAFALTTPRPSVLSYKHLHSSQPPTGTPTDHTHSSQPPTGTHMDHTHSSQPPTSTPTDHTHSSKPHTDHTHTSPTDILTDYFRLHTDLTHLYTTWSTCDMNFDLKASRCKGVRLLRQDPLENLLSFICSSNNNISRISLMMNRLCQTLGDLLCCYGSIQLYGFPRLDVLCRPETEKVLRGLGFGYRAKYVAETCRSLAERGGTDWLHTLREKPYDEVWTTLQSLCGVGAKVADCVAMMSLDKLEAVPIDTHMWSVATRDYGFEKKSKTLTARIYKRIGDHFRLIFGDQAGWATTVLFVADLGKTEVKSEGEARKKRKSNASRTMTKKLKT